MEAREHGEAPPPEPPAVPVPEPSPAVFHRQEAEPELAPGVSTVLRLFNGTIVKDETE